MSNVNSMPEKHGMSARVSQDTHAVREGERDRENEIKRERERDRESETESMSI